MCDIIHCHEKNSINNNVQIFLEATPSSHESCHVGRTDVQLSRDIEMIWICPRDTELELPIARNMVYFQDYMSN